MVKNDIKKIDNSWTDNTVFYTVDDISDILQIGKTKTYQLFKSPSFPSMKIGRDLRIEKRKFDKWVSDYSGREYKL